MISMPNLIEQSTNKQYAKQQRIVLINNLLGSYIITFTRIRYMFNIRSNDNIIVLLLYIYII